MERKTRIEPGLLPVFRLLTAIRLGLAILATLGYFWGEISQHGQRPFVTLLSVLEVVVLLGYLSWSRLQKWLGRTYLPLSIVLASLGPILVQRFVRFQMGAETAAGLRDILSVWELLPALLVPLFIVAWQYNFGVVLAYSLGTGVLDFALMHWLVPFENTQPFIAAENAPGLMLFAIAAVLINRTAISVAVGFMVTRLMRTQREQRAALLQANTKLTHYATTLEQLTTSRERNRLARELHDTLAHTLSALAVQLGAVDALWDESEPEARALLTQSLAATRTGLTETRRALHDLRASPLEDLGMGLALRSLVESMAARNGFSATVDIHEFVDTLSPPVEQCLYRVAQEALENVSRHAAAHHVAVRLEQGDGHVTLTISDDGQGFDLDTAESELRLGLRGMQERADMVGGTLTVESTVGQGTTITLTIASGSQLSAVSPQPEKR